MLNEHTRDTNMSQNRDYIQPPEEPEVFEDNRARKEEELHLTINRIPFEQWSELKGSDKRGKHVLDVAMRSRNPISSTLEADESSVPVRLAINSIHVLHELSKIANMGFRIGRGRRTEHRNVVIPPWKPFVMYHDAIRESLQALKLLQSQRGTTEKAGERSASTGESKEELKGTKTTENFEDAPQPCEVCEVADHTPTSHLECLGIRISHLQCLVGFLDNDLKHVFDMRRELAAGNIHEIAFEHLWHLFHPGDLIVSPNQSQAYRVFQTGGGRPVLSRNEKFEKCVAATNFKINCFHIDFNQTTLGPVYEMVSIAEYSGKRKITALCGDFYRNTDFGRVPVFPARFLRNRETFIANLINRGRRLHKLEAFSFKRYYGFGYECRSNEEERRGYETIRSYRRQRRSKVPVSQTSRVAVVT